MGGYRQYKIETKHLRIILLKESIFAELLIIFFRPLISSDVVKYNCIAIMHGTHCMLYLGKKMVIS